MKDQLARRVRRIEATDPIATAHRYDYADAVEVHLPGPDAYSPETWVRAGFEASPWAVKRIVRLLGSRRAPQSSADYVGGFRVLESGPEVIHLEMSAPPIRAVLVGRRVEPTRRMLTTILYYERPVLARLIWAIVGPAHRRTTRHLITSKISTTGGSGDDRTGS